MLYEVLEKKKSLFVAYTFPDYSFCKILHAFKVALYLTATGLEPGTKLAKWLGCVLSTYLYGAFDCMFLSFHVRVSGTTQFVNWARIRNHLVWPNGWVFVYKLSESKFKSSCSHLNFKFRACFEQGVPSHSGNYRVRIQSETRTCHDKNIHWLSIILFKIN